MEKTKLVGIDLDKYIRAVPRARKVDGTGKVVYCIDGKSLSYEDMIEILCTATYHFIPSSNFINVYLLKYNEDRFYIKEVHMDDAIRNNFQLIKANVNSIANAFRNGMKCPNTGVIERIGGNPLLVFMGGDEFNKDIKNALEFYSIRGEDREVITRKDSESSTIEELRETLGNPKLTETIVEILYHHMPMSMMTEDKYRSVLDYLKTLI